KLLETFPTRPMGTVAGLLLLTSVGCSSYLVCSELEFRHPGIPVPVYREYLSVQAGTAGPFQLLRIPDPGYKCWVTERRPCNCTNSKIQEQKQKINCMPVAANLLPSLLDK